MDFFSQISIKFKARITGLSIFPRFLVKLGLYQRTLNGERCGRVNALPAVHVSAHSCPAGKYRARKSYPPYMLSAAERVFLFYLFNHGPIVSRMKCRFTLPLYLFDGFGERLTQYTVPGFSDQDILLITDAPEIPVFIHFAKLMSRRSPCSPPNSQ